jgi:hypothetical protein
MAIKLPKPGQLSADVSRSPRPPAATKAPAAHVQAAIGNLVQRRMSEPAGAKILAPHVQAALAGSAQPRKASAPVGRGPIPPLAQAKLTVPARPTLPPPASRVQPPAAGGRASGVVQRKLIVREGELRGAGYLGALQQLLVAARSHGQLRRVLEYVEDEDNAADLVFGLGRPDALAETDFMIGDTVVGVESELVSYLRTKGVAGLARERLTIRILINAEQLGADRSRDILQTLAHEYAIHAMKYPSFLIQLRQLATSDLDAAIARVRQEFRYGSMSGTAHHRGLIEGTDAGYATMKDLLLRDALKDEASSFLSSEEQDISGYRMEHAARSSVDMDSVYANSDKAEGLNTPLISFKMKKKPQPQPSSQNSCCCFLTTACTAARGLAEDCHELTTLRAFRDGWLRSLPDGDTLVERYYEVAPQIVEWIQAQPDAADIWDGMYDHVVRPTVALIEAGENRAACELYGAAVRQLQAAFLRA